MDELYELESRVVDGQSNIIHNKERARKVSLVVSEFERVLIFQDLPKVLLKLFMNYKFLFWVHRVLIQVLKNLAHIFEARVQFKIAVKVFGNVLLIHFLLLQA